jgi:hypothetical protein
MRTDLSDRYGKALKVGDIVRSIPLDDGSGQYFRIVGFGRDWNEIRLIGINVFKKKARQVYGRSYYKVTSPVEIAKLRCEGLL